MWNELPAGDKEEYKRMILAFASLTEMFAQKTEENDEIPAPIINSKYQETIFQRVFHASAEDIGNTSYDVALSGKSMGNRLKKYLIGIKTFGIGSGDQKVAQFKANINEWSSLISQMQKNVKNEDGSLKNKDEVDMANQELYKKLAVKISTLRNERIRSSIANLQGFRITDDDEVESVYHVLMPSQKGRKPEIYVGETSYDQINIEDIEITGCSSVKNPSNFAFSDGKHTYRYTSADSQLYMKFNNEKIVLESWPVRYAEDAYGLFSEIADRIYGEKAGEAGEKEEQNAGSIIESYSWNIAVQRYSGFNSFYGVGSKLGAEAREERVKKVEEIYRDCVPEPVFNKLTCFLRDYLLKKSPAAKDKEKKESLRKDIVKLLEEVNNHDLERDVKKLLYRPVTEMYIPIPNARVFHETHPDFFGKGAGRFKDGSKKLLLDPKQREFNLIFEPSGDSIPAFISQDDGKAIESVDKQTILGEWILKGIFQLKDYEPLTEKKLNDLGINGIRLYKTSKSDDIHLEFIWIGEEKPDDYIGV